MLCNQKINELKALNLPVIVAGDLNVILEEEDVYN
jgi:exonuclease III